MSWELSDELLDRLNRGETDAVEVVFQAFSPYLKAIVRRQLSDHLRSKFDSSDVVQSVWVQVVQQLDRDGWHVENADKLRGLLATIARRRLISQIRHLKTETNTSHSSIEDANDSPPGREARPSQIVQADELWSQMLRVCPPEHHEVLRLRRQGLLLNEIAERTGLHEGSVRRIIRQVSRQVTTPDEPTE